MRLTALPLAFLSAAGLAAEPAVWTPELALKTKRVSAVAVSPDGGRAAFVVARAVTEGEKSEWLSQIHLARTDGSGGFPLTRGEKPSTAPAWSPDGRLVAFLSSRGSGKANVWVIPADGGEAESITDEKGGIAAFRWSPDGSRIAFLMPDPKTEEEEKADREKRDAWVVGEKPRMIRLYVVPLAKGPDGKRAARKLTDGSFSIGHVAQPGGFDWSPDGKSIVFSRQPSPRVDDWTRADVSVVDADSGAVRALASTAAAETEPFFSPDGTRIALDVSDVPPTWASTSRIHVVPAAGGAPRPLARTRDERPNLLGWSADGKLLLVSEVHGTVSRLSALPADGGPPVDLSPADLMVEAPVLGGMGKWIGFASPAPDRAPEPFASRLDSFSPVPLARVQELPEASFGRTEVVTWSAPDGRTIEGLLTYPVAYAAGSRVPLLVVVHGGPAGVFQRSFTGTPGPYLVAAFAGRGYAVLRANVRGSSGYGREFRYANYRDWGGGDYRDIISGIDTLVGRGIADRDRLGIMGWSYGGFMTSWVITQTRRFKAASVGAGVTNLMSFTGTADIPSFLPDYFGGEVWDAFDRWRARSAMFNVKGVTTPTLIQHGDADLRVPISQAYELHNALERQGVETKMVVYPRQAHSVQEPKLMLDLMTRNLEWFDRFVMGKPAE
jgi:dipeptidyl aminopeptidase/acylaminoacyl peptidase